MALERLQKIIAAAGIASRRKAEELIQQGLVSVNGAIVTELGTKADPDTDSIRVNSKLLQGAERHEYIALNKPKGYVTTVSDPEGRPTVMELVRSKARLYPIGRLDFNSEGLLLLTNDGDLAHKLMKAASHIPKTYLVKVAGQPAEDQLRRLRSGVSIAEEREPNRRVRTAPAQIRVIKEAENPWLEVTLREGRNRQIRKMFEEVGHHVEKIRRVRYGPLELDLPPGESRILTSKEVSRLQQATEPQAMPRFNPEQSAGRGLRGGGFVAQTGAARPSSFPDRDGGDQRPAQTDRTETRPRLSDSPARHQGNRERSPRSDQSRVRDRQAPRFAARPVGKDSGREGRGRSERSDRFSDRPRRNEGGKRSPRFGNESRAAGGQRRPSFTRRPRRPDEEVAPDRAFENRPGEQRPARGNSFGARAGSRSRFAPRKMGEAKNRVSKSRPPRDGKRRPPNKGNRDGRS